MPTFIPPYLGEEVKSNAEKKIFEVLQELDLKNVYVLHSLGLPKHQSKIYGEIDFVVVCDRGIACLEIKGGRVECRDGRWFFTDRYGVEREKTEGPFAQVTGNMFSLKTILKERFSNQLHSRHILVGCGVMFPDIEFKSTSQEIIPEMIYDKRDGDITAYMNRMFDYWSGRQHRTPDVLSPADIKEIVTFLRGNFMFIPSLADRLEAVEQKLLRLTNEQAMVMQALSMNEHLLVEGGAGTGKTVLAMEFARQQAKMGKKVLYLAYNKNLVRHVAQNMGELEGLDCQNIHAMFGEHVLVEQERMQKNPTKYFEEELPEAFFEYISSLKQDELETLQYDLLVLDEGQDLLRSSYLYALDYLLKGGLEKGRWAVFFDGNQNIYNTGYQEGMELISSYHATRFRLMINCRNTVQIGTYGLSAGGIGTAAFLRENGEEVRKISFADSAQGVTELKGILKELKREKVSMQDVVFLSPKKYAGSMVQKAGILVRELGSTAQETESSLPFYATIQGYKGLDAKIVILVDTDDIFDVNYKRFVYIAATRARTMLYVVGSEAFWRKYA